MMPTGRFSRMACPSAVSSAATSRKTARACRSSASEDTRGNMNPNIAQGAGAKNGPELGTEQERIAKREPQASQSQDGVGLGVGRLPVHLQLVGTQVEGPDDDGTALERTDHLGIGLELLVLAGGRLGPQEQELGAEQADAHRAQLQAGLDLAGELDVAPELDPGGVERLGRQVGLLGQNPEPRRAFGGGRSIALLGGRVGIEDDQALIAIDDGHSNLPGRLEKLPQTDDRRDLQRGGDDGGMAGLPPAFGGEAQDPLGVQPRRLAGREVLGQDQRGGRQLIRRRIWVAGRSTG